MYLMYVDESGDPGMPYVSGQPTPTNYFCLTGLVIHELRWRELLDSLLQFRKKLLATYGLRLTEEFHAAQMLTRPGSLVRIAKHNRLAMIRNYADELAKMTELNVINVVVDKSGKPPTYDVFENAWRALLQRFENTLVNSNFPQPKNEADRGLLLPDRTDVKRLTRLQRKMRRFNPVSHLPVFGAGYRNLQVQRLVEDPSFRDSSDSYFIQSADLCAFLLYQHLVPSAYVRAKSAHRYFLRLQAILCKHASSTDPLGIVRL